MALRESIRQPRLRNKPKSLNFEKFAAEGNRFINDVAEELQCGINTAARITRAVLHALRDRMPHDEAIQFAQGLPMALKGIYIDQYDISRTPVVMRKRRDFLAYVYRKNEFSAMADFPHEDTIENSIRGVFYVLGHYMDPGQINQVKNVVGREITKLLEEPVVHV